MTSKSGGHNVRNLGHQDHEALKGRALSASRSKSKKLADRESQNGGGCAEKDCEINRENSFKTTSNGGYREELQPDQNNQERGVEKVHEIKGGNSLILRNSLQIFRETVQENNVKILESSFKTTSIGGREGQEAGASLLKQMQVKILAKKLANQND